MTDLTTQAQTINRVSCKLFHAYFAGLAPNTVHVPYLDGEDHSFATRQYGQEYGEALMSDDNGNLEVYVLRELKYNRQKNYELPQSQSINYQNNKLGKTNSSTVRQHQVFEVTSYDGTSSATKYFSSTVLLTAGADEVLYPTE